MGNVEWRNSSKKARKKQEQKPTARLSAAGLLIKERVENEKEREGASEDDKYDGNQMKSIVRVIRWSWCGRPIDEWTEGDAEYSDLSDTIQRNLDCLNLHLTEASSKNVPMVKMK